MVLYSQLVCSACRKVLTYHLGAISCKCRNCHRINPSLHMEVMCEYCETMLYLPVNTLTALCPCCFTVTEIPIEKLPLIDGPVVLEGEEDASGATKEAKTIYVEHSVPPVPSSPAAAAAGGGGGASSSATTSPSGPNPPTNNNNNHHHHHRPKVSVATQIPLGPLPDEPGHFNDNVSGSPQQQQQAPSRGGRGGGGRGAGNLSARNTSPSPAGNGGRGRGRR